MSLYPSLEDMKVDHMIKAQLQSEPHYGLQPTHNIPSAPTAPSAPLASPSAPLYPFLGEYMGLELSEEAILQNMPEYAVVKRDSMDMVLPSQPQGLIANMVAPLSGQSAGLQRAQVTNGIRELTLCKDKDGKVGLRVHPVNEGVFVCLVSPKSPAALAGLRFGDQILEINGESLAGYSMEKVHKIFRNCPINGINVVIRDRPFERTITMHKYSSGHIGFQFKNGKIIALIKDSSAARNGLLTDHQILEVNGKNVIGLKDKEITAEIEKGGDIITITVIPSFIYDHMIKKMNNSLLKSMDHSVPNL
ncbi:syntenin-1 [Orussus abietinus]|uniref:syntenin-1 n=1 Tax=Orussus abietinus TaxID=222816 RepID=UPI000626DB42|nr:syntenin-1 [Orussus abietinus]